MVKLFSKSAPKKAVKKDGKVSKEPKLQVESQEVVASEEPVKLEEKVGITPAPIILPVEIVVEPLVIPTIRAAKPKVEPQSAPVEKPAIRKAGPPKYCVMRTTKISLHGQICLFAQGDVICPSSYGPHSVQILLENLPLEEVKD